MTDHRAESVVVTLDDDIWDDLFHGCALAAFIDQAIAAQAWPDPEATRRRAYEYYEVELAKRHWRSIHSGG